MPCGEDRGRAPFRREVRPRRPVAPSDRAVIEKDPISVAVALGRHFLSPRLSSPDLNFRHPGWLGRGRSLCLLAGDQVTVVACDEAPRTKLRTTMSTTTRRHWASCYVPQQRFVAGPAEGMGGPSVPPGSTPLPKRWKAAREDAGLAASRSRLARVTPPCPRHKRLRRPLLAAFLAEPHPGCRGHRRSAQQFVGFSPQLRLRCRALHCSQITWYQSFQFPLDPPGCGTSRAHEYGTCAARRNAPSRRRRRTQQPQLAPRT